MLDKSDYDARIAAAIDWAHGIAWSVEAKSLRSGCGMSPTTSGSRLAKRRSSWRPTGCRLPTVRPRIEALDLRVKQARDLPAGGGTA